MERSAGLVARNLTKRYGAVTAVDNLSFEVEAGEIFGLLGPNGAGKTTTLEMIEGLRAPDSGECHIRGLSVQKETARVREIVGLQFQTASLMEDITVQETIDLYTAFYPKALPVGELLRQFSLAEKAGALVKTLSGGQKQRLALAVALVGDPEVVFLDEPTTGLDPAARRSLWDVIRGLKDRGRTVLLTTHYMEEAEVLCDRLAIMDHGKIMAMGTPRELIRDFGSEMAVEFTAPPGGIDARVLAGLPEVTGVKVAEQQVVLYTGNTEATLIGLITHLQAAGLHVQDLRTRTSTLEDVFLALTGRRLRD